MWSPLVSPSPLEQATRLIADAQIGLEIRGYPPRLVRNAIERARGAAVAKVAAVSPAIRDQAFLDVLKGELKGVEQWMQQVESFLKTS